LHINEENIRVVMEKEVINPNVNKIVRVEFLKKLKICGFCAYRK
jgi:hypothetical protein